MNVLDIIVDVFTLIGILFAVLEFYHLRKATLAENERTQKQATLDFYMTIKDELYAFNHIIYERYKRALIPYSEIKDDDVFIRAAKSYLNTMEIAATGINTGIYNIYVFDRLYGDVCVRVSAQLSDYIKNRRLLINEPEIYRDYDLLCKNLIAIQSNRKGILNSEAMIKHTYS